MKKIALVTSSLFALPLVAAAQGGGGNLGPIQNLIVAIGNIVALLIPICIGLAMLAFFWGLVLYIREPEKKDGTKIMIAGLVSLFIMVSIWGIIQLAQNALLGSTNSTQTVPAPHFPTN